MRPGIDLGRLLGAELYARGTTPTEIAKKCGRKGRTIRSYARGEYPIPAAVARELVVALDDQPFVFPEVRDALVIRGRAPDPRKPPNLMEPVDIRVDTVILTLEVDESRRDDVGALLVAEIPGRPRGDNRLPGYRYAAHAMVGSATVTAHWDHWRRTVYWLRLQLSAWEPEHCRLLQRLLRCASERAPSGLLGGGPTIRLARLDVAINYPVEPICLVLHRPRASIYWTLESKDSQRTWYSGVRQDAHLVVRFYDWARCHQQPGPVARIEAQRNFRTQIFPRDLDGEASPFKNTGLGDLFCPDLDIVETALLSWAREAGLYWTEKRLDKENPADAARLRSAIAKAKASPRLESPTEIMEWMWPYLVELLRTRLFWHEVGEGDLQPWSYPPAPTEEEAEHDARIMDLKTSGIEGRRGRCGLSLPGSKILHQQRSKRG